MHFEIEHEEITDEELDNWEVEAHNNPSGVLYVAVLKRKYLRIIQEIRRLKDKVKKKGA